MGGRWRPNEFSSIHWVCLFTCFPWKKYRSRHPPSCRCQQIQAWALGITAFWRFVHHKSGNPGNAGWAWSDRLVRASSMKLLTGSSNPNSAFQVGRIHAAAETSKGYVFWHTIFSWTTTCSKWSWSQSCKLSSSKSCTPPKTNLTMENPPWMKMYFLWKIAILQCHVSFQEGTKKTCVFPRLTIYNAQTSPS